MDSVNPNSNRNMAGGGVGSGHDDNVMDRLDPGSMEQQSKTDESDAPPVLPYQLSAAVNSLGDIFVKVLEAKKIVNSIQGSPGFTREHGKVLKKMNQLLDHANKCVADSTSLLDEF